MYYVRLGIHLFSSKTLSNMLLLILVALSLIMSNVAIGIFNMQFSLIDSVQNFDKENTYYYMDIGEDIEDSYDEEGNFIEHEPRSIVETIKNADKDNVFDVGYIYYDTAVAYRQQRTFYSKAVTYIGVDNKTSEKLNYGRLIQGEWYTKAPKTKDYVNVVAVEGNYEVGDKFNIVLENYDKGTDTNMKCIVTGLLEQGTNMLIPDGGTIGTSMNLEGLMQGIYTEKNGNILSCIYFSYEDENISSCLNDMNIAENCFLYAKADAPKEKQFSTLDELSKTGWAVKMQKICDNTYDNLYDRISYIVPFMFGIFLLTIVCLVCVMTLNATDYMKTYSVYYLCGMNWSDMKKILLSYAVIIMAGATIISSVILLCTLFGGGFKGFAVLNANNIFISLGIVLTIVLIMVLIPYLMLSRTSPKDALRNS